MIPPVPFREIEELRNEAELFLRQYHPSGEVPVPIESIVEFDMGLEIRPIRALRSRFGVDGYLSADLETIVVDEDLIIRYPPRYRFTLAHEVGHRILHPEQVRFVASESVGEWKIRAQGIPSKVYGYMEFQAYEFAGQVLVPRAPLLSAYQAAADRAAKAGIDLAELQDYAISQVAGSIARQFDVSTEVIERRLKREGVLG